MQRMKTAKWRCIGFLDNQGPEEEIDLTAQPMEIEEEKPADEDTGDMEVDQNGKQERFRIVFLFVCSSPSLP